MISASWICVLLADGYGRLVLNGDTANLPMGWNEQKVAITRSPTYKGLFREVTTSLRFVTEAKDFVQQIYEKEGVEFIINIAWYQYNEPPLDKYLLFFAGLVDLSTYAFTENYVECDINESSLSRKIMSRDDIKINLATLKSIEGIDLPVNNEVTVNLHQRELLSNGSFILNQGTTLVASQLVSFPSPENGFTMPILLDGTDSDISNLQNQSSILLNTLNCNFWAPAGDASAKVTLSGTVSGLIHPIWVSGTRTVNFLIRVYDDDTFATIDYDVTVEQITVGTSDLQFSFDIDTVLNNILPTQTISFISNFDYDFLLERYTVQFDELTFDIKENKQWKDGTPANGYLMHEVGERITQAISDKISVFKSDFLGRIELGYAADGEGSLQTVHSGKQIRIIPDVFPSLNLNDWYKSLNAQHSFGIGIEYDEFGAPYVRAEKLDHFFSGQVITTIHSVTNMRKEVAREWIYNEVEVGYSKAEYEKVNGLEEYNNKFEWADSIGTIKNKLDLISPLRADGYGIEFARRLQGTTEDSKYDNENFTVIVAENGENYKSVKDENYDFVENIFSPETAYNLDITPGRMLRNNGSVIRAGLEHYLTDPLRFQLAEQKADLTSQRTGGFSITENENIDVSTLDAGLWIPEIYEFDSILIREQLAAITRNQNGIIKFSTTTLENTTKYYYGWILEVQPFPDENTSTWRLLRVNTKNPNVKLIDPEGNSPNTPPIPVDPSTIFGIFEGPFEFVFSG